MMNHKGLSVRISLCAFFSVGYALDFDNAFMDYSSDAVDVYMQSLLENGDIEPKRSFLLGELSRLAKSSTYDQDVLAVLAVQIAHWSEEDGWLYDYEFAYSGSVLYDDMYGIQDAIVPVIYEGGLNFLDAHLHPLISADISSQLHGYGRRDGSYIEIEYGPGDQGSSYILDSSDGSFLFTGGSRSVHVSDGHYITRTINHSGVVQLYDENIYPMRGEGIHGYDISPVLGNRIAIERRNSSGFPTLEEGVNLFDLEGNPLWDKWIPGHFVYMDYVYPETQTGPLYMVVEKNNIYRVVDENGDYLTDDIFLAVDPYRNGYMTVWSHDNWGYTGFNIIDSDGHYIYASNQLGWSVGPMIQDRYYLLSNVSGRHIMDTKTYGIADLGIDKNAFYAVFSGEYDIRTWNIFDDIRYVELEVFERYRPSHVLGDILYDRDTDQFVSFDTAHRYHYLDQGVFIARQDGKVFLFDVDGNYVCPTWYDEFHFFGEGDYVGLWKDNAMVFVDPATCDHYIP